jgi:hypothetical protein
MVVSAILYISQPIHILFDFDYIMYYVEYE